MIPQEVQLTIYRYIHNLYMNDVKKELIYFHKKRKILKRKLSHIFKIDWINSIHLLLNIFNHSIARL